jgi:Sulfotransferase domain
MRTIGKRPRRALYRKAKRAQREVGTTLRRIRPGGRQAPGFLILGAAKAGTTSLHHYLSEHPRVQPPSIKEIHYFDHSHPRGWGWYLAHFPANGDGDITGEATPYYLFHPLVPQRVAEALPDVRLIALLRNPVDRAISHHNHELADSYEDLPLEEAVECEEERLRGEEDRMVADPRYRSFAHQHHSYLARGRYAEQLERWFEHFDRDRLLVLSAEDLFEEPRNCVEEAQRFLGLEPVLPSDLSPRNNRSYSVPDTALRKRLQAYFEPHNQRLYRLLGRDFGWE